MNSDERGFFMTVNGWLQIGVYLLAILAVTPLIGRFMTRVFNRERTWLDPILRPLERLIYRATGVDETHEMRWTEYAVAMLALQRRLDAGALCDAARRSSGCRGTRSASRPCRRALAFNTAASFTTNTNWQAYSGESTMSYLTQMAGLAFHNFASAATGIALAIAFIRGIAQREKDTLGNFWVDLVRCSLWMLLPFCLVGALFLVSQGVVQNLRPYDVVTTVEGAKQTIAQGPVASQEIIKELGTNGGGFFNANSAHPFENPTPLSNFFEMFCIFAISAGLTFTLGDMTGSRRHGWAVWAAMAFLFLAGVTTAYWAEARGNPMLTTGRRKPGGDRRLARRQHGGQRGPLRHRQLGALRHGDDRRQLRRDQQLARLVHAARRPGAADQHHARRSDLRRRRRRDVRHPDLRRPVGVHRRPDGRPHARVPRQEDRGLRRADGHARRARLSAHDSRLQRDLVGGAVVRHVEHPQSRPARPVGDPLRLHLGHRQQRLGLRRTQRQHELVQRRASASRCWSDGSS